MSLQTWRRAAGFPAKCHLGKRPDARVEATGGRVRRSRTDYRPIMRIDPAYLTGPHTTIMNSKSHGGRRNQPPGRYKTLSSALKTGRAGAAQLPTGLAYKNLQRVEPGAALSALQKAPLPRLNGTRRSARLNKPLKKLAAHQNSFTEEVLKPLRCRLRLSGFPCHRKPAFPS